jgi:hypothetical protein
MGWINVHWGVSQVLDASTSFPHEVVFCTRQGVRTNMCFLVPNLVHN